MELFYSVNYRLRPSDYRPVGDTLSSVAILDILQDLAGDHAKQIGVGFEDFIKRDLVWMIVSTKYEFIGDIPMHASVVGHTWPRQKGKIDFIRDYKIDYNGKTCVRATSRWIIANAKTRHIYIPRDIEFPGEYHIEENPMTLDKLKDFDVTGLKNYTFIPKFMDLDHNGHVNNIKYARYIEDVLELKEQIKSFSITYVKEAKLGDKVEIYFMENENIIDIKGVVNEETCFLARIER